MGLFEVVGEGVAVWCADAEFEERVFGGRGQGERKKVAGRGAVGIRKADLDILPCTIEKAIVGL